jgi:hypothetical protein
MLKPFWRAETGFFLGYWLFFMVGARNRLFRDPGTFWHTVVGRQILGSGRFPETDSFSFTRSGQPWIPHQWLGECLMAIFDRLSGLDTLLLASATVLACLYTWLAHRLLRSGLHWLPTVLVTMLTVASSANHLHVRPHICTIVFTGITFGRLCDFEAGRIGLRHLWWLVPIFWAWSNMHGGVLGGLAMIVIALCGWCVFRLVGLDSPVVRPREVVILALLIVACGLTFVMNPYGRRLPRVWLEIMSSPVVARLIEEHAPLSPRSPEGLLILLFGLIYLANLASLRPWRPRVTWLLPLFWLYETITRVRHSPLFSITAALAMAEMLPYTRLATVLARPGRELFQFRTPSDRAKHRLDWRAATLPLALILLAFVLQAKDAPVPILGRGWVKLDPTHWPVAVLPELRQVEREHPEGARILNDFLYGGFLIYFTPGLNVFIDDRCELYGDDWLLKFSDVSKNNPAQVEEWQEQYNFQFALVESGSPFDHYFEKSPSWAPLGPRGSAKLYRRY